MIKSDGSKNPIYNKILNIKNLFHNRIQCLKLSYDWYNPMVNRIKRIIESDRWYEWIDNNIEKIMGSYGLKNQIYNNW
jgi:hypothetical protein